MIAKHSHRKYLTAIQVTDMFDPCFELSYERDASLITVRLGVRANPWAPGPALCTLLAQLWKALLSFIALPRIDVEVRIGFEAIIGSIDHFSGSSVRQTRWLPSTRLSMPPPLV